MNIYRDEEMLMNPIFKYFLLMSAFFCALSFASFSFAAPTAKKPRKIITLEAIKVEGKIQKPQAFYILQRSNLNFESLDLKTSFIKNIISSVEQSPF